MFKFANVKISCISFEYLEISKIQSFDCLLCRYKTYDYLGNELKMLKTEIDTLIKTNFEIPGLVGQAEKYKIFSD